MTETRSHRPTSRRRLRRPRAIGGRRQDERLAYRGLFQRMFIRPEIGALIGVVGIWVFFWAVTVPFGTANGASNLIDYASSPLGIMAVAVSMLMIGGEFDLSAGAMTGAMGILVIMFSKEAGEFGGAGLTLWIAIPLSLAVALGIGYMNGTLVEKTRLPSFTITLATYYVLIGAKLGFSKLIVDQVQVGDISDANGYGFWNRSSPRSGTARRTSSRTATRSTRCACCFPRSRWSSWPSWRCSSVARSVQAGRPDPVHRRRRRHGGGIVTLHSPTGLRQLARRRDHRPSERSSVSTATPPGASSRPPNGSFRMTLTC